MYDSYLNNHAHENSIWFVSKKDMDIWLSLPADPPVWTTIFPDPEWMLQLQSKSGVHVWLLWLLTFSSYSLRFDAGVDWKMSLTPGKHFVMQKHLILTLIKYYLKVKLEACKWTCYILVVPGAVNLFYRLISGRKDFMREKIHAKNARTKCHILKMHC